MATKNSSSSTIRIRDAKSLRILKWQGKQGKWRNENGLLKMLNSRHYFSKIYKTAIILNYLLATLLESYGHNIYQTSTLNVHVYKLDSHTLQEFMLLQPK